MMEILNQHERFYFYHTTRKKNVVFWKIDAYLKTAVIDSIALVDLQLALPQTLRVYGG